MYVPMVVALLLLLPVASILIQLNIAGTSSSTVEIALRWFVFWAVGVRLLLAGLRQVTRPDYTAKVILGLKSEEPLIVVRELGIANTAIGCVGVASVMIHGWSLPMALAGAVFYGLAGMNHATHRQRGRLQDVAMVSDLLIAVVLACCFALVATGRR